jgi:hypothetical protein
MVTLKGLGILPTQKIVVVNRTGGPTLEGGVYAVDIEGSDVASTDADSNLTNIIAVSAGNMFGFLVCVEEIVADDAPVVATIIGNVQVLMEGTIAIVEGSALEAVIGQAYLVNQSVTVIDPACAMSLQAYNAAPVLRKQAFFDGWAMFKSQQAAS